MKKIEYRQFIDEVYFLGEKKEYNIGFSKLGHPSNILKSSHKILEEKRKIYDFDVVSTFRKYQIAESNLYEELDSIWEYINLEECPTLTPIAISGPMLPTSVYNRAIFKKYIDKTRKYAEKVGKGQINQ